MLRDTGAVGGPSRHPSNVLISQHFSRLLGVGAKLLAALLLVLPVIAADAVGAAQPGAKSAPGRIYKWVDEHGVTHYGQAIPPEYRDQDAAVMNRRGVTVDRIQAAPTAEDLKAREEKAAQEQEESKRLRAQKRRDQALMSTYSSPKEIDDAKERNLLFPKQALRGLEPRLKQAEARLRNLQVQVSTLEDSGREIPQWLQEDTAQQEAVVEALRADIRRHTAAIESIQARYDAYKKRYIELTEARAP